MEKELELEFVPYQEARDLRNLGFDKRCFKTYQYFDADGKYYLSDIYSRTVENLDSLMYCPAPTFSQAFRWFTMNYNLHSWSFPNINGEQLIYAIVDLTSPLENLIPIKERHCNSVEEGELLRLRKLIKIVKQK